MKFLSGQQTNISAPFWGGFFFLAVLGLAGVLVLHFIHDGRRAAQHNAEIVSRSLATVLTDGLGATFAEIDLLLKATLQETVRPDFHREALPDFLVRQQSLVPQLAKLGLFEPGDNPGADGLSIGYPVHPTQDGPWLLPLSRRAGSDSGTIAYADLPMKNLTAIFLAVEMGPGGAVILFDSQRNILARYPEPSGAEYVPGRKVASPEIIAIVKSGVSQATYQATSTTDGIRRTYSFKKVGEQPLFIMVGLSEADYLVQWRSQRTTALLLYAAFAAVVTCISLLLLRLWKKRGQAIQSLTLAQAALLDTHRKLERRTAELSRTTIELERFTEALAHHFQEPVRIQHIFVQRLARNLPQPVPPEALRSLQFVQQGADRLRLLLKDVLRYLMVAALSETETACDACAAATAARRRLDSRMNEAEAELIVGPLPRVVILETHLTDIFEVILENAITYRHPARSPVIRIFAESRAGEALFSVVDNGIGIEPAYRERVFKVFERLHRSEDYPGSGIGLALVRKIVSAYGGRAWIEDGDDTGISVRFALPGFNPEFH